MGTLSRLNWNLEMLVFEERENPEYLEKTSQSKDENQQQTPVRESNLNQIGGRGALSPLRYPCSPLPSPPPKKESLVI